MKYLDPERFSVTPRSAVLALVIACAASTASAQSDRPSEAGNVPSAAPSPAPLQQALGRTEADEAPAPAASPSPATTAPVDASGRGYWGLAVQPLGDGVRAQLKGLLVDQAGLAVVEVEKDGPAAKAGLRPHDVIIAIDGEPVGSPRELVTRVRKLAPGRSSQLTIIREAKKQEMTLSTAALPANATDREPADEPIRDTDWDEVLDVRIEKVAPEKLSVRISFVDDRGASMQRTFTGTRAEIRSQVMADPELSASRRNYVLRAMRSITRGIVPEPFHRPWPFREPSMDSRLREIHEPWISEWPPFGSDL